MLQSTVQFDTPFTTGWLPARAHSRLPVQRVNASIIALIRSRNPEQAIECLEKIPKTADFIASPCNPHQFSKSQVHHPIVYQ